MKILTSNNCFLKLVFTAFLAVLSTVFIISPAISQPEERLGKAPLHIVSDKMIAKRELASVEFIGNVKATQEDSVVTADSIKVIFVDEASQKDAKSSVKQIISTGNVEYTTGDRKAFADQAVYTSEDETLVLTGKAPRLVTGTSFVTGKKITLFRNQDKVLVESDGKKRVEATFNPEDTPDK